MTQTGRLCRVAGTLLAAVALVLLLTHLRSDRAPKRVRQSTEGGLPRHTAIEEPANVDTPPVLSEEQWVLLGGTVMNDSNQPVGGAEVYAMPASSYTLSASAHRAFSSHMVTATDGHFTVRVRRMDGLDLIARKPGYVAAFRPLVNADPGTRIVLVLRQGGIIAGAALDVGGAPVAGVRVRARSPTAQASESVANDSVRGRDALDVVESETDAAGRFCIAGLQAGRRYLVEAFAEGYACVGVSPPQEQTPRRPAWREWITPDQRDVRIVVTPLLVAVLGIRARGFDVTSGVRMSAQPGSGIVRYPAGCAGRELIRVDLLTQGFGAQLRDLSLQYWLLGCTPVDDGAVETTRGEVRLGLFGDPSVDFDVTFRRVGMPGWDTIQWLDSPDASVPSIGEIVVVNETPLARWPAVLLMTADWRLDKTGVFVRAEPTGDNDHPLLMRAPAGRYVLVHEGCVCKRYDVEVVAGETREIRTSFRQPHLLTVRARYPSGGVAREIGVYVRKAAPEVEDGFVWLRNVLEPFGCEEGMERLIIRPVDWGPVEVVVKKRGFTPAVAQLTLGEQDAECELWLEPDPFYGW